MPAPSRQPKPPKRCSRACERCRVMKVKCSGSQPCVRCSKKKRHCHYALQDKRVSIPESYLHELERRNVQSSGPAPLIDAEISSLADGRLNVPPVIGAISEAEDPSDYDGAQSEYPPEYLDQGQQQGSPGDGSDIAPEAVGSNFSQNPLVDNDYTFAQAEGKYWYMGPSSSWSFCRRVLALLGKRIPESQCVPDPWHLDGMAFRMQWRPLAHDEAPDVSNLPPLDYALFLFNAVKFYFGVIFYLIDEEGFLQEIHQLYRDPATKAKESRLWYSQYLLVLAFGKAIINNSGPRKIPSGHQYAVRAMSLMPDLSGMNVDANKSIEVLALAALYLQSVDMRVAAFQHIGQALRTCIIEGIHRHVPEEVVGEKLSKRCNAIFWVVYMLERDFSAQIGAPSTIRDEDITAKLPSEIDGGLVAWNMSLHVQFSRLMARILTTVYGVGREFGSSLVKNTQSILRNLAQISGSLTELLNTHFQGSVNKASRIALRLVLTYHHCVVLSTRPLVMCALHAHMEHAARNEVDAISLTPPVLPLVQSCVDSALTILQRLRVLGDQDLLEAFLPFQLENAFSSAFILHLVRVISPSLVPDESWKGNIDNIIDQMIARGSLVAPLRKIELRQLESMMVPVTPRSGHTLTPNLSSSDIHIQEDSTVQDDVVYEPRWDVFVDDATMGLSPRALLDLAEQLDVDDFINQEDVQ